MAFVSLTTLLLNRYLHLDTYSIDLVHEMYQYSIGTAP